MTDYRPGNVYSVTHADDPSNITYAAQQVGTQPIWSDDLDDSYVAYGEPDPSTGYISQARGDFAAIPTGDYVIRVRAQALTNNGVMNVALQDKATNVAPVTMQEMAPGALDWYQTDVFAVEDATTAASPMVFIDNRGTTTGGPGVLDFRVYEVILQTAGSVQPYRAPLRLYPREDGLGMGTGQLYPPPRSIQYGARTVGGYL